MLAAPTKTLAQQNAVKKREVQQKLDELKRVLNQNGSIKFYDKIYTHKYKLKPGSFDSCKIDYYYEYVGIRQRSYVPEQPRTTISSVPTAGEREIRDPQVQRQVINERIISQSSAVMRGLEVKQQTFSKRPIDSYEIAIPLNTLNADDVSVVAVPKGWFVAFQPQNKSGFKSFDKVAESVLDGNRPDTGFFVKTQAASETVKSLLLDSIRLCRQ